MPRSMWARRLNRWPILASRGMKKMASMSCDLGCSKRFFFFSSRRRHTRSFGDWSSDVCSSDLALAHPQGLDGLLALPRLDDVVSERLQQPARRRADLGLVVDDEDVARLGCGELSRGRMALLSARRQQDLDARTGTGVAAQPHPAAVGSRDAQYRREPEPAPGELGAEGR